MALTRPILYSVPAFDATFQYTFLFNVVGGDQVVKNQLTITDQSNNQVVYQEQQTTFAFRHTISANTLVNGNYYSASLITYNSANESSISSLSIQFYCYTNPSFNFNNIPVTNVITNSNYVFEVSYDQNEGELLNSYTFNLYDAQRNLLSTSGMRYTGGFSNLPLIVSYLFNGLQDNTFYFIQATGQTSQGTEVSTGFVGFSVSYVEPSAFSVINLTNNCQGGYIIVKSNLSDIPGKSNPSPPLYIDDNTAVDVTGDGSYIIWDEGFSFYSDFTISLWGRNFTKDSNIITLSTNGSEELTINYREDENGLFYAELFVKENNITYYLYTVSITISNNDSLQIWVRRIAGLYEIGLYNLS